MSKAIRLVLVLTLATLAFWSSPKISYALPTCDALQGRSCTPPKNQACNWLGGGHGICICDSASHTWDC